MFYSALVQQSLNPFLTEKCMGLAVEMKDEVHKRDFKLNVHLDLV